MGVGELRCEHQLPGLGRTCFYMVARSQFNGRRGSLTHQFKLAEVGRVLLQNQSDFRRGRRVDDGDK